MRNIMTALLILFVIEIVVARSPQAKELEETDKQQPQDQCEKYNGTNAKDNSTFSCYSLDKIEAQRVQIVAYGKTELEDREENNWLGKLRKDPIAIFTALLFFATIALWLATRDLVKGAAQASERQLRAYIEVTEVAHTPVNIAERVFPNRLDLSVMNSGSTPAYNLTARLNWQWFPEEGQELPEDFQFVDYAKEESSVGTLGRDKAAKFTFFIDGAKFADAVDGKITLFYYGHIDYLDIYKNPFHTNFCYVIKRLPNGRGGTAVYHRHNDAT